MNPDRRHTDCVTFIGVVTTGTPARSWFIGDMTIYSTILFIHVMATLGLAGAIAVEGIALRQLRHAPELADTEYWLDPMPGLRISASICLLLLFLSGGYLTDRLSMWQLAWPKVAVAIVLAFGALAGSSSRRLTQIRKALHHPDGHSKMVMRSVKASFFKLSLSLRTGLVLAAVFLMTVKPNLMQSVGAVLALLLIFLGIGSLGTKSQEPAAAAKLEPSTR